MQLLGAAQTQQRLRFARDDAPARSGGLIRPIVFESIGSAFDDPAAALLVRRAAGDGS